MRTWLSISFAALGAVGVFVGALPAYGHHAFAVDYFRLFPPEMSSRIALVPDRS
jgi:hypothetical protein